MSRGTACGRHRCNLITRRSGDEASTDGALSMHSRFHLATKNWGGSVIMSGHILAPQVPPETPALILRASMSKDCL